MTSRPAPRKQSATPTERFTPPPRTPVDPGDGRFPVFPPRGDMQNPIYLHDPGYQAALRRYFGSPETTIVLGEVPIGRDLSQRRGLRVPDLLVAFGVGRKRIITDRGYSIEHWGKPPDFVLEIASETTAENDVTGKRDDYAAFGVPEYWLFDPSGGEYYGTSIAGNRLVEGAYQSIDIVKVDDSHYCGHSEVLGLDLCWEDGWLRWYDPAARRYLRTLDEEAEERIAAEEERDAERRGRLMIEEERDAERRGRLMVEEERDAERRGRLMVEEERDAAQERIRELEAEMRRLQG